MTHPDPSIGIFDSGFGGLTVMRAIRHVLPHENIIYFGDTARLPYGSKSADTIARYSLESASFLVSQGIKVLVIACHTACAATLEQLRKAFSIPIIGITEQGIEEISRSLDFKQMEPKTRTGRIAILGTRATISSGVYQQQIGQRLPQIEFASISCPLFVPLVEEGYTEPEHPLVQAIVQEYLRPLKHKPVDAVLLGCTHYPLLHATIKQELGSDVILVDPAAACAEKTRQLLEDQHLLTTQRIHPHYQFYVSDDPEKFRLLGKMFLDYPIEHVLLKHNTSDVS
jgi:glutamate racemase